MTVKNKVIETIVIKITKIVVVMTEGQTTEEVQDKLIMCPWNDCKVQVACAVFLEHCKVQVAQETEARILDKVASGVLDAVIAGVEVAVKMVLCNTTCKKTPPKTNLFPKNGQQNLKRRQLLQVGVQKATI